MVFGRTGMLLFRSVLVSVVLAAVLYLFLIQLMHPGWGMIPGDLGDARFNNYVLEHGYKWVTHQVDSFWSAPFFFPVQNVIAYSDSHLGTLPFYSLARILGFDRESSYQVWLIFLFTADFLSCYLVLRALSISCLGAILGGILFTFAMPVFAQVSHSQLFPRFMVPPALYFFNRYLTSPCIKLLSLTLLCVQVQLYCTIYIGYFLCLALLSLAAARAILDPAGMKDAARSVLGRRQLILHFGAVAAFVLLLVPLVIPYYESSKVVGFRSWRQVLTMLPQIQSYLYAPKGSLWLSVLGSSGDSLPMAHEHHLFAGLLPYASIVLILFLRFVRGRKDPLISLALVSIVSLGILFILTLNAGGYSLYRAIFWLPGPRAVRAVTRIGLVELMFLAIILGTAVTKVEEYFSGKRKLFLPGFFACILAVGVLDQHISPGEIPRYSKSEARDRSLRIEEELLSRSGPHTVFAYVPGDENTPDYIIQIDAMMAAQNLNISTVNGYSGSFPSEHFENFLDHYSSCDLLKTYLVHAGLSNRQIENIAIVGRDGCPR